MRDRSMAMVVRNGCILMIQTLRHKQAYLRTARRRDRTE